MNPIVEWWPAPITFPDEPTTGRNPYHPPVTDWHNRPRPTSPMIDPWGGTIDDFIHYLTGTERAPGVSLSQHSDDMPEYGAHGYDSTITTFEDYDLDGNPIEPALPASHGWTIQTEDTPIEVAV